MLRVRPVGNSVTLRTPGLRERDHFGRRHRCQCFGNCNRTFGPHRRLTDDDGRDGARSVAGSTRFRQRLDGGGQDAGGRNRVVDRRGCRVGVDRLRVRRRRGRRVGVVAGTQQCARRAEEKRRDDCPGHHLPAGGRPRCSGSAVGIVEVLGWGFVWAVAPIGQTGRARCGERRGRRRPHRERRCRGSSRRASTAMRRPGPRLHGVIRPHRGAGTVAEVDTRGEIVRTYLESFATGDPDAVAVVRDRRLRQRTPERTRLGLRGPRRVPATTTGLPVDVRRTPATRSRRSPRSPSRRRRTPATSWCAIGSRRPTRARPSTSPA